MCAVLSVGGCAARPSNEAAASSSERDNFSREGRAAAAASPHLTAPFKALHLNPTSLSTQK